jgi:hypothetical protein
MLITILIIFAVCFIIERTFAGWELPAVPTWTIRVLAINFVQLLVIIIAGFSWEKWLSAFSLWHLSDSVPNWLGGIIAYFIATFISTGGIDGGMKVIFYGGIFIKFITVHSVSR